MLGYSYDFLGWAKKKKKNKIKKIMKEQEEGEGEEVV